MHVTKRNNKNTNKKINNELKTIKTNKKQLRGKQNGRRIWIKNLFKRLVNTVMYVSNNLISDPQECTPLDFHMTYIFPIFLQ